MTGALEIFARTAFSLIIIWIYFVLIYEWLSIIWSPDILQEIQQDRYLQIGLGLVAMWFMIIIIIGLFCATLWFMIEPRSIVMESQCAELSLD